MDVLVAVQVARAQAGIPGPRDLGHELLLDLALAHPAEREAQEERGEVSGQASARGQRGEPLRGQRRRFADQGQVDPDVEVWRAAQAGHRLLERRAARAHRGAGQDPLAMAAQDAGVDPRVQAHVVAAHDEPPHGRLAS